jgi:hypothetical protein
MIPRGALELLVFGDGVVVGLALAIPHPSQESQRDDDYADTHAKFSPILHKSLLIQTARL